MKFLKTTLFAVLRVTFQTSLSHANLSTGPPPDWIQIGQDIDGEAAGDYSGWSVSLSSDGTRVAIGARYNDGTGGTDSGHVRIWDMINGTWSQVGQDLDGESASDYFGWSVSLSSSGSRVAVGAPGDDRNGPDSGHVRVYDYTNDDHWTQLGQDIDGEAAGDDSGEVVKLSSDGMRVAIASPGTTAGQVRIFDLFQGQLWLQVGPSINGEASGDQSGYSMDMSSDGLKIAIGARYNDGNGTWSGHVRVYGWLNGTWVQLGSDIDGEASADYSGWSVSLSSNGSRVAIGAPYNDTPVGSNAGHVRVYDYVNDQWDQIGQDIDGEAINDYSGHSVSLSDDGMRVAVGAYLNDGGGSNSGHVIVYELVLNLLWLPVSQDIDGEAANDYSSYFQGVSLSSNGARVAIGAYNNDGGGTYSGHVRVYQEELGPSALPSPKPSVVPSFSPSKDGSMKPTSIPSSSVVPSFSPTKDASMKPTSIPSSLPSKNTSTIQPSIMPSSNSPTSYCEDSPIDLLVNGRDISCDWIQDVNGMFCLCDLPGVKSHCPLTCGACNEHMCSCTDSNSSFIYNGSLASCDLLDTLPPEFVISACLIPDIKLTCRQTCGLC